MDIIGASTLVRADSLYHIFVHLNNPSNGKPHFDETPLASPFGLPVTFGELQLFSPDLVDIDNDGDLDMFVIVGDGQTVEVHYYENELCQPSNASLNISICEGEVYEAGGMSFSEAGTYEILLTNSVGCDSIIQLALEVTPLPERFMDASICAGETFQIGGETFSVSGNYSVYIANNNGCDTLVMLNLVVIQLSNEIIVNDNILTSTQAFASYQWINCDTGGDIPGAENQFYEVTATGNYAVVVSSGNCSAQSSCQFVMITGINDADDDGKFVLYPNPTRDKVYIVSSDGSVRLDRVEVWSLDGKRMLMQTEEQVIDLGAYSQGVYVVRVFSGEDVVTRKVVRE